MDPLLSEFLSHLFPDNYPNGPGIYVENPACSSVISFMGHSFMLGGIHNDVNVLAELVFVQIFLDPDCSTSSEWLGEHFPGLRPVSK